MVKFSSQFLSYYDEIPKGEKARNMVFLPIWIWKIFAPVAQKQRGMNFFQKTILELLEIGYQDRKQIAQWVGVDPELIDLIIDTELEPNGWVSFEKDKIALTQEGYRLLEDEIEQREDLQPYYLIQDAITGQLWHRLIPNSLNILEVQQDNKYVKILGSRDAGNYIAPFVLEPQRCEMPRQPTPYKISQTIKNHNWAMRGALIRDHEKDSQYIDSQSLKNYEFYEQTPEAFFILSHLEDSLDSTHLCQLQDPCHVSQFDDWIQGLHLEMAKCHSPFSNKIKRYLKQDSHEQETVEEFEERLLQEIVLEIAIDFPFVKQVENLEKHVKRLISRKKNLEDKQNYYDIDDLINQSQKALEACFKNMLRKWKHPHPHTTPQKLNRDGNREVLSLRAGQYFNEELLAKFETVNSSHVYSANGYSTGKYSKIGISLKPLIVSSLLSILDHQYHPLIRRNEYESDLENLSKICETRNDIAHDSGQEIDITTALNLSNFTLDWISFYTSIEA